MTLRLSQVAKLFIGLWMAGVMIAMFLVVPQYEGLGNAGRIVIMHVPTAWVSVVAFLVSAIYSILYLRSNNSRHDDIATAAAESGFLFTIMATVTGAIFSEVVWGVYWNWDPRQTSIFVLLLIYAALFALRAAIEEPNRKRQLSAVYSIFAFVTVPFLIFIAPRMAESTLHPNCAFIQGSECDGIVLREGQLGLLGDRTVQLVSLEERGNLVVADVLVREPGFRSESILTPSYDLTTASMGDRPDFPGLRFQLGLEEVNLANGTARLNIEAPGTGLLENQRTSFTFFAAIIGFSALFVWMVSIRATLLGVAWSQARREGAGV